MIRKTVTIRDELFYNLELTHITSQYKSFSELVSTALELLIEKEKKEYYREAMIEASKDELYIKDMKQIQDDFQFVDFENIK